MISHHKFLKRNYHKDTYPLMPCDQLKDKTIKIKKHSPWWYSQNQYPFPDLADGLAARWQINERVSVLLEFICDCKCLPTPGYFPYLLVWQSSACAVITGNPISLSIAFICLFYTAQLLFLYSHMPPCSAYSSTLE